MVDELVKTNGIKPAKVVEIQPVSKEKMAELWKSGISLTQFNVGGQHLMKRCRITKFPSCLRVVGNVMIAKVSDPDGNGVQIHKTKFDENGIRSERLMMRAPLPPGSAIRLYEPVKGVLGVAEGIETAISAAMIYKCPVWALINANNLEKWTPPPGVDHVMIFGDNDLTFTGQAAAYSLARRLVAMGNYQVDVHIPKESGHDWNDVHMKGDYK